MYIMNEEIKSMYCIKCNEKYPVGDYISGCPKCLDKGEYAAVSFRYKTVTCMDSRMKDMQPFVFIFVW